MSGQTPPQEPQRAGRQAERRRTLPTPAEAEALVMSLGQQEKTYAEAQAQMQKIQEERQGREARQQAVQQQALLFSQLDQANRALQHHPAGSLAWERAQREQQEIERRIAALRSPAGATVPAAGQLDALHSQSPAARQPAPPQDRSESEYREAIQGWARVHGWTVRHGTFGGSQRDWQIGLMGVGRRDLAQLAGDLGV